MDENKKNKIKKIIESMKKEGNSTNEIRNTLITIGLTDLEADELLNSVSSQPNLKDLHEKVSNINEVVLSGKGFEPVVKEVKKMATQSSELNTKINEIHGNVTEHSHSLNELNNNFSEHKKSLDELNKKVDSLTEKHEAIAGTLNETTFLKSELREVKEMLIELKPLIKGMAEMQQQLIDINKQILLKLKK